MNRQRKLRRPGAIFAFLVVGIMLVFLPSSTNAQVQPAALPLDGLWLTDGYGELIEFHGDELRSFQITQISCIPVGTARRRSGASTEKEIAFEDEGDVYRAMPGSLPNTRWLHEDGSVSIILLRRTSSKPKVCARTLADTPMTNYRVFWETFAENYPFFALRRVDWLAVDKKFQTQVKPPITQGELFRVLSNMIEPLHDAHSFINANTINKRFHGYRPDSNPLRKENAARIRDIIERQYLHGEFRDFCNERLQFGMLDASVGYLRIQSFDGYSKDKDFASQLVALENALDEIFQGASRWTGMVIDVRINGGGSDVFGISIASRLTARDYIAYSKVARNDIHNPDGRTSPQAVIVHSTQRPSFHGPVVLLTSSDSVSAAETFAMAVRDRLPRVIRVGEKTQGVFSDILVRELPNGWGFGLPNEVYLTYDGKAFDGVGVPPDIDVAIFADEDLSNGQDSALNEALNSCPQRTNN